MNIIQVKNTWPCDVIFPKSKTTCFLCEIILPKGIGLHSYSFFVLNNYTVAVFINDEVSVNTKTGSLVFFDAKIQACINVDLILK